MTKSWMRTTIKITLILISSLIFFQPVLGEELSGQEEVEMKGKIFGDQLMVFESGRKSTAEDGIYTTEDGTKITVKDGKIVEMPSLKNKGTYSSFRIIEVDYFETD
jgi:hypothetical protein